MLCNYQINYRKTRFVERQIYFCISISLGKRSKDRNLIVAVIPELAKQGKKKLLVFSPAFVADCLETLYEIRSLNILELLEVTLR
ncbi:MAG: ferrochelatase [Saprospirales bacterium]|nr:ferrochelatase [Saprospirales bacterium]